MELKSVEGTPALLPESCSNRTFMELKCSHIINLLLKVLPVLIVPLWN